MTAEMEPDAASAPLSDEDFVASDTLTKYHGNIKIVDTEEYETNVEESTRRGRSVWGIKRTRRPFGCERVRIVFELKKKIGVYKNNGEYDTFETNSMETLVFEKNDSEYAKIVFDRIVKYIRSFCTELPAHFYIKMGHHTFTMSDLREAIVPRRAPAYWPGRRGTAESLPDFFRRVWGKYIPLGLTLAHIRKRDRKLYNAILKWIHRDEKVWPADLNLPTQPGILNANLIRYREEGPDVLTGKQLASVARKLIRMEEAGLPIRPGKARSVSRKKALQH